MLVATGGQNAFNMLRPIHGTYTINGSHHGKVCYTKDCSPYGAIYFWDGRDDPIMKGWWFGKEAGSTQVWARHLDGNAHVPPSAGWQFPYIGTDGKLAQDSAWLYPHQGRADSGFVLLTQPITTPLPPSLCCYIKDDGQPCGERRPCDTEPCGRNMCKHHCRLFGTDCGRHNSAWEESQSVKYRGERAHRRRGVWRTQRASGPYHMDTNAERT